MEEELKYKLGKPELEEDEEEGGDFSGYDDEEDEEPDEEGGVDTGWGDDDL